MAQEDVNSLYKLFEGMLTLEDTRSLHSLVGGTANEAAERIYEMMGQKGVESPSQLLSLMQRGNEVKSCGNSGSKGANKGRKGGSSKKGQEEGAIASAWGLPQDAPKKKVSPSDFDGGGGRVKDVEEGWVVVKEKGKTSSSKSPVEKDASLFEVPLGERATGEPRVVRIPLFQTLEGARESLRLLQNSPSESVKELIKKVYCGGPSSRLLVIMRGVPGSGKSTLAQVLYSVCPTPATICSADCFFTKSDGRYIFDKSRLGEAHSSCQAACEAALKEGQALVVVDNTNTTRTEVDVYVKLGIKYNYDMKLQEPVTEWKTDAKVLVKKNTHGVPKDAILRMIQRYERLSLGFLIQEIVSKDKTIAYNPPGKAEEAMSNRGRVVTPSLLSLKQLGGGEEFEALSNVPSKPLINLSDFVVKATSSAAGIPPSPKERSPLSSPAAASPKLQHRNPWVESPRRDCPPEKLAGMKVSEAFPELPAPLAGFSEEELFLLNSFPDCGEEELVHFFRLCQSDLNDTISLLLDSGYSMTGDPNVLRPSLSSLHTGPPDTTVDQKKGPPGAAAPGGAGSRRSSTSTPPVDINHNNNEKVSSSSSSSLKSKSGGTTVAGGADMRLDSPQPGRLRKSNKQKKKILQNEETIVMDGVDWVDLKLPDEYLSIVYDLYGEINGHKPSEMKASDKTIRIPREEAFAHFNRLYLNIHQRLEKQEMEEEVEGDDEDFPSSSNGSSSPVEDLSPVVGLTDLELQFALEKYQSLESERFVIDSSVDLTMEEVMAVETRNKEIDDEKKAMRSEIPRTFAFKYRLDQLKKRFPSLSADYVDDVLVTCGFSYEKALEKLKEKAPHKFVEEGESPQPPPYEEGAAGEDGGGFGGLDDEWRVEEEEYDPDKVAAMTESQVAEVTAVADHWKQETQKRSDKMDSCRSRSHAQRNVQGASAYYTSEANLVRPQVIEAQQKYAYYHLLGLNGGKDSSQIDLHGQPVKCGVRYAIKYLQNRQKWVNEHLAAGQQLDVRIITGRGKHSRGNVPRLQLQVVATLSSRHYSFYTSSGEIRVHLRPQR